MYINSDWPLSPRIDQASRASAISRLPEEILLKIFTDPCLKTWSSHRLGAAAAIAATCRHWKSLAEGIPELWRSLNVTYGYQSAVPRPIVRVGISRTTPLWHFKDFFERGRRCGFGIEVAFFIPRDWQKHYPLRFILKKYQMWGDLLIRGPPTFKSLCEGLSYMLESEGKHHGQLINIAY
jgi:hypothetical protein